VKLLLMNNSVKPDSEGIYGWTLVGCSIQASEDSEDAAHTRKCQLGMEGAWPSHHGYTEVVGILLTMDWAASMTLTGRIGPDPGVRLLRSPLSHKALFCPTT
jgi:hypothetical protein